MTVALRVVLALALLGWSGETAAQMTGAMRPLVIPFENTQREPRLYWLSEGSSVLLTDHLVALGAQAITREDRLRAFERMNVPPVATLSHATVIKLGQLVGATHVVIGSFDLQGGQLSVRARVLRLDTGRLLPEVLARGPLEEALALYARVGRLLVPESTVDAETLVRGYPPLTAFEPYIKGLLAAAPAAQLAYLDQALKLYPAFHRVRLAQWEVYDEQGDHALALAAARQVPEGTPLARAAQFRAGLSLMNLSRYDDAYEAMSALNRARPDPALLNNLGVIQLRRVKPSGLSATSLFSEAAKLDPEDPDLFFNAGYSSWLSKDPAAAIAALREVVRRNAADDEAHYVLGVALQATGATAEAAREKELAKRLSSTYAEWEAKQPAGTPVPKGLERIKTDVDVPGALRVTTAMAASEQRGQRDQAAFHLDRGRRLLDQERDSEALEELRRAVYLAPYQSEAHLLLGRVYLRMGRATDAVDALKISIWSEDTIAARLALADVYLQSKEPAAARAELDIVLKREPNNVDARRMMGMAK